MCQILYCFCVYLLSANNGFSGFSGFSLSPPLSSHYSFCEIIIMNNNKNKEDDITIEMLEKKENPVMDYRLTKKSALGMFLVALASTFGR